LNPTVGSNALASESGRTSADPELLFRESRGLIHQTLVTRYRIPDAEAVRIEEDLEQWFIRFCERPGAPGSSEARHTLLLMACVFARATQRYRLETGERAWDEALERFLRRDPVDVAREASRPLKILYRRLHEPFYG
jgi:hypothetical protein